MLWRISKEIELAFGLEISTSIRLEYGHERKFEIIHKKLGHLQTWFHKADWFKLIIKKKKGKKKSSRLRFIDEIKEKQLNSKIFKRTLLV